MRSSSDADQEHQHAGKVSFVIVSTNSEDHIGPVYSLFHLWLQLAQVLKRGQQVKKTVDLAEGATVKVACLRVLR